MERAIVDGGNRIKFFQYIRGDSNNVLALDHGLFNEGVQVSNNCRR